MTGARRETRRPVAAPLGGEPLRTCVGCRRVRGQGSLLRLARTPDGFVEADPDRRAGGRGAYLCFSEKCLDEAMRRSRWGRLSRGPVVLRRETIERVRALVRAGRETGGSSRAEFGAEVGVGSHAGSHGRSRPVGRLTAPLEGGW